MKQWLCTMIWNVSESTGVGLGRFAPAIFEGMINIKGHEVDSLGNKLNK